MQKLSLTVIGDGCLAMEYSHPAEKEKNQLFVITNIQKAKMKRPLLRVVGETRLTLGRSLRGRT